MARRQLLTDEERTALLGIPADPDALAQLFTPSRADRALVAQRRGDANRLGCAVQLALLRHPGTTLAYLDQPVDALVAWMARHLDIPRQARWAARHRLLGRDDAVRLAQGHAGRAQGRPRP